jgi:NitT/TauT family transport system permease protein
MPMFRIDAWLYRLLPLILFFVVWQLFVARDPRRQFFFGSPRAYAVEFYHGVRNGNLARDTALTASEAVVGFLIGNILGATSGFMLWKFPMASRALKPYITLFGSAPLFAFAPIIVIWFGTGFAAKVVVAIFSTVFVALSQAFTGAEQVNPALSDMVRTFGGNQNTVFRKIVIPSSLVWVFAGFRLNVGLALLGAFLGEYISSEAGLGHVILVAGGLYNIPQVLVAVTMIGILGVLLSWSVGVAGQHLRKHLLAIL